MNRLCCRALRRNSVPDGPPLRLVLIGKTGVGKSAVANTILGENAFKSCPNANSVTEFCEKKKMNTDKRDVYVIDTPGILDTTRTKENIKREIVRCIQISAPGPHAFLLVIQIGRFTNEEQNAVKALQELFGEDASKYMVLVFTHADLLQDQTIEDYVKNGHVNLKRVVQKCGNRYIAFNNTDTKSQTQVKQLITLIDNMVKDNRGECYTQEMFQEAERRIQQRKIARELAEKEEYNFSFLLALHERIILFQKILNTDPSQVL